MLGLFINKTNPIHDLIKDGKIDLPYVIDLQLISTSSATIHDSTEWMVLMTCPQFCVIAEYWLHLHGHVIAIQVFSNWLSWQLQHPMGNLTCWYPNKNQWGNRQKRQKKFLSSFFSSDESPRNLIFNITHLPEILL